MRKLVGIFLSGVVSLGIVATSFALEYKEAPVLRTKVAAGELPAVEERLPEEPLVVEPAEEIGEYGGTWRRVYIDADRGGMKDLISEPLVRWTVNLDKIVPNTVKGWEFGEDAKSITFYLRKGMKWSDGAPFTADDFVFYWNNILLNKELNPVVSTKLTIEGEPGTIKKIDDYTFRLSFSASYGMIVEVFANRGFPRIYAPEHYLREFHPQYTSMDKIEKMMKKEGYTLWTDLFSTKNTREGNPELPVIEAWYPLNEFGKPIQMWTRNPYYWKVDTEGNQLPYIDGIARTLVSDSEMIVLKSIAGDVDFYARRIESVRNYPIVMENREKGDYRVILGANIGSNIDTIYLNLSHKDPVLRKLFRDKRFRIALSIAINREDINQLLFAGVATPAQPSPSPGTPWYEERFSNSYIEYNPEEANKLLDEIGLKWDKNHEYRLRSDGKRLRFVNTVFKRLTTDVPQMELVNEYWKKIGIEAVVKPMGPALWYTQIRAAEHDVASILGNFGFAGSPPISRPEPFPVTASYWAAPMWGLWYSSGGKSGEEPPAAAKRLIEIYEEVPKEMSLEKRIALQKEALEIHRENLWMIGTVREPDQNRFFIAKNNLRNVPTPTKTRLSSAVTTGYASQLFFKK